MFVVLLLLLLSSGVMLAMVTLFFSSFFLSSPHFFLIVFSITFSSHCILLFPCLFFPSTFWASALFSNCHLPFCPCLAHLSFTNFFLKCSFTPTSILSSSILLLTALFTPTILLMQLLDCKVSTITSVMY